VLAPALVLALSGACSSPEQAAPPPAAPPAKALLPAAPADFAPSHVRLASPAKDPGATLADVDSCESCHADVAAQWRTSAHAFASFNNPIYRTSIDRLRRDRGVEKSRFCAGCHDVALLVDGAMDREIAPKDLRAHAGITCRTCHGIVRTRLDGNGSYDLDTSDVPLPVDGDDASVARHKQRVATSTLRTAQMCGACHRAFLDATTGNDTFLIGQDDYTPWSRSEYAGSRAARVDARIEERDCRGCHMQKEEATRGDRAAKGGKISSHRFLGAHTWLAAMRGDAEQVKRIEAFMAEAVTIDVAAIAVEGHERTFLTGLAEPKPFRPAPGDRVVVDVVVRNRGVGHRFPGGVMDAQDAWVEILVEDAKGRRLGEAGLRHAATGADLTAHRFASAMIGADGAPLLARETHLFRASAYNHTIPARDAEVVQYSFEVPAGFADDALPLRIVARLQHRTRNLPLQRAACAESKSERSKAFGREGLKRVARNLDPCLPQPILELARAEASAGGTTAPPRTPRSWGRQLEHGLGLLRVVQERLDEARPSLELARETASSDHERAMATWALAQLAASQGATDEALRLATTASSLAPGHPAIARTRGEALAAQWRWREAAPFFFEAASASPKDDAAWSRYAVVLGGASKHQDALDSAQRALSLQPRDADALRVQGLALEALNGADCAEAMQAYLDRRTPDDAPKLRNACMKAVPGCVLERNPVHMHAMRR
jgi:tetratricopeptide (TPR) repeat protein